jgi:hypothetical protein
MYDLSCATHMRTLLRLSFHVELGVIETRMVLHILAMDFDSPYYSVTSSLTL